jgi:hypothetical protein
MKRKWQPIEIALQIGQLRGATITAFAFQRMRSCTGKVKYGHAGTARTAAADMSAKTKETLESYKCGFCNSYHVGHANSF